MLSTAKFRYRFRPFLALLVGSVVALSTFAVLYADAYRAAERLVATYSLERQVAELLSGTIKSKRQPSFSDAILGYRDEAKVAVCVSEIKSLVNMSPDGVVPQLSIETRKLLLQNKNCAFFETKISDWLYFSDDLVSALLIGLAALLVTSVWSWVATYPHVGWRRFALVLGPVSGVIAWVGVWWLDEYEFRIGVAVVVVSATCVAAGLLAGLKGFEWVRHGFDAAGKGEA